jgi:hypothetical protein
VIAREVHKSYTSKPGSPSVDSRDTGDQLPYRV